MKKTLLFTCFAFIFIPAIIHAQDDLMNYINTKPPAKQKVVATFKSTKIINAQTNETVHKRTLDFRIAHRFGNIGSESGGSYENFYGLYSIVDVRISFEYGITDKLTVGLAKYKRFNYIEGLAKYRLLEQTTDNKIPIAITLFGNAAITTGKDNQHRFETTDENGEVTKKPFRRLSYCSQMIIARKFSQRFSFEIIPSYVHRNYVDSTADENDLFSIGAGGRFKITRSFGIVADYFYTFSDFRNTLHKGDYFDPLSVGIEIETGGHVFTIMFSNSSGLLESDFITNTRDSWKKGGFKFSFNISRNFRM